MKFKPFIPILCSMSLAFACSRTISDTSEQAQPAEAEAETETESSVYGLPPAQDAYLCSNGEFIHIERGDAGLLMPTNAERGFGFAKPAGTKLPAGSTDFSVLSETLHAEQLQITQFRGIATATTEPYVRVDNANTAWLPGKSLAAKVRSLDPDTGFSEITLEAPLAPGFYVLHDETLFRAHVADEVTAFYPFIVTSDEKTEWQITAEACFGEIHKTYGDTPGSPLDAAKPSDFQKSCISDLRLLWKSGDAGRDIEKQLVYLGRLSHPKSNDTHQKMLGLMDETQNDLSADLWKIEQADQMYRLANLYTTIKPDIQEAVLAHYGLPIKGALKNLTWLPFSAIAQPDDTNALADLFDKILSAEDYTKQLVRLLGAIHYDRVHRSALAHAPLGAWFRKFDSLTPAAFKTAAAELHTKSRMDELTIGPFRFQNVPEDAHSAWKAAVTAKLPDLRKCIAKGDAPHGALLLVSQPLNGTGFGREITGSMREIGNEDNKLSSLSQSATTCILKVFGSLPSEPALDQSQHLKVAITIPRQ